MEEVALETKTQESTAAILLNNIIAILNNSRSSQEELEYALKPFTVIQWARQIIEKLGINRVNRVFGRLKRANVPKATLRLIIDHFKTALSDQGGSMPAPLVEWRTLLTKYSLNQIADYATWTLVIQFLATLNFPTPASLAEMTLEGVNMHHPDSPYKELVISLWQAIRIEFAPAKGLTPLTLQFRANNFSLVDALRAQNVETSEFGVEFDEAMRDLTLPDNFLHLGPKARIIALQNSTPDSQQLLRFLSAGAQKNILEQVRSSMPQVASGVGCYLAFCSLLAIAPFPPAAESVARWSAVFKPGKTFGIYLSHLAKACQLMGIDCSWKSNDTVIAVAKGLRNKPSGKIKFHNSLEPATLNRLVKTETWSSELAQISYIAFLFMLRLPSEALPLKRALPSDRLLCNDISSSPAVIGLREFHGEQRLVIKLAKRKNTRDAFSATRPCFCGDNFLLPRHNCPIHRFWKAVIATVAPGAPLFPNLQGKNFSRILRAVLGKLEIPDAEKYSSHCFRRGAAAAILNSGSTLSEIMRTGGWASSSFKVYLDLHRSEELAMKDVLKGNSPSSSRSSSISETSSVTSTPIAKDKDGWFPRFPHIALLIILEVFSFFLQRLDRSPSLYGRFHNHFRFEFGFYFSY